MYLLRRIDIDEVKSIHHEDAEIFHDIIKNNMFDKEDEYGNLIRYPNRLELITDRCEIKKVLDEKFSSRHRTEEYEAGLPSATVISSALFPMDIDYRKNGSKFPLLKWWNNTSLEDMNAQKIKNKLSTDSGTLIHAVLEYAMNDMETRIYTKKRSLDKYISMVCESPDIVKMIDNFEDRKFYFVEMAQKTLTKFFENEIEHITPVVSELFINLPNKIQGAVDLLCYYKKRLTVLDYKTSKGSKSRNQLIDSGYVRQLYVYSRMLYMGGYITKKELEELQGIITFYNWNSHNSFIHEFTKEEIDKCKAYVNFVYNFHKQHTLNDFSTQFEL